MDYRKCSNCGTEIFPFTIVDAQYKLRELLEQLRRAYKDKH